MILLDGILSTVPRVGKDGQLFDMWKASPLGSSRGVDELGQLLNICAGDMNVIGHRPLSPEEFEWFLDTLDPAQRAEYLRIVMPTKPGILSSLAIAAHACQGYQNEHGRIIPEVRATHDIDDVKGGSEAKVMIARLAVRHGFRSLLPKVQREALTPKP